MIIKKLVLRGKERLTGLRNNVFMVFLFLFLIMLASSGGHLDVWDGKGYFLLTQNLVKHHSLILQPDLIAPPAFSLEDYFGWLSTLYYGQSLSGNHSLNPMPSVGSPLFALVGVPFYYMADSILNYDTVKFTSYFVNSLIISLMGTVVFAFASELYRSQKIGFVLSLIATIGSFIWPYVSSYLEQPLAALISVCTLYFLYIGSRNTLVSPPQKRQATGDGQKQELLLLSRESKFVRFSPLIAGLFLGLQSFGHAGTIMIVPGIAITAIYIFRKDRAKLLHFLAGFLFFVALQSYINLELHGSVSNFGYGLAQYVPHNSIEGLYGLIVSPGHGIIAYFPLAALLPISIYCLWRQTRIFCITFLYVLSSIWIFYGTLEDSAYWSGIGWGPRYMVTIIPVLALMIGSVMVSFSRGDNSSNFRRVLHDKFNITNITESTINSRVSGLINYLLRHFMTISKIIFVILSLSGFVVNLLGVLIWYQVGYSYSDFLDRPAFKYTAWDPAFSPILLHWNVLTTSWWTEFQESNPIYAGWETCMPDNFIYCNLGFLSLICVLVATILLGVATTINIYSTKRGVTI